MLWAKTAGIVTGASEGIGASCANLLKQLGARVSLSALPGSDFEDSECDREIRTAGDDHGKSAFAPASSTGQ